MSQSVQVHILQAITGDEGSGVFYRNIAAYRDQDEVEALVELLNGLIAPLYDQHYKGETISAEAIEELAQQIAEYDPDIYRRSRLWWSPIELDYTYVTLDLK